MPCNRRLEDYCVPVYTRLVRCEDDWKAIGQVLSGVGDLRSLALASRSTACAQYDDIVE